jgi:hypothetical protein
VSAAARRALAGATRPVPAPEDTQGRRSAGAPAGPGVGKGLGPPVSGRDCGFRVCRPAIVDAIGVAKLFGVQFWDDCRRPTAAKDTSGPHRILSRSTEQGQARPKCIFLSPPLFFLLHLTSLFAQRFPSSPALGKPLDSPCPLSAPGVLGTSPAASAGQAGGAFSPRPSCLHPAAERVT